MINVTTTASLTWRVTTATQLVTDRIVSTATLAATIYTQAQIVAPEVAGLANYDRRSDYTGLKVYMAYAPKGSTDDQSVWTITVITTTATGEVESTHMYVNVKWTEREIL
mgnify:CR=1 FL=1